MLVSVFTDLLIEVLLKIRLTQ